MYLATTVTERLNKNMHQIHTVLQHRMYQLEESLLLFSFLLSFDAHPVSALQVSFACCHDRKWLTCIVLCAVL